MAKRFIIFPCKDFGCFLWETLAVLAVFPPLTNNLLTPGDVSVLMEVFPDFVGKLME